MKKLSLILLIDDDDATNYIHKFTIEDADCTDKVVVCTTAIEALIFLSTLQENGSYPQPDIIFLDINMPGMNGWEFLDEYEKLIELQKAKVVIIMLTTSLSPIDAIQAEQHKHITAYKDKPLSRVELEELIDNYF